MWKHMDSFINSFKFEGSPKKSFGITSCEAIHETTLNGAVICWSHGLRDQREAQGEFLFFFPKETVPKENREGKKQIYSASAD